MDIWNRESLLKEIEETQRDDILQQAKNIDLDQFRWDDEIDINRCETSEDIKLLEDVLTDGQYDKGDISYIVENAAQNMQERKRIDNELKYINEQIAKNEEQVEAARKQFETFNFDECEKELHDWGKDITMENISKMTPEQVNKRLREISEGLRELRKADDGLGSVPEISDSLRRYQNLLKGTVDLRPKGAVLFKDFKFPKPKRVTLKEEMMQRAEKLNMPDEIKDMIKRMDKAGEDKKLTYETLVEMAKKEGVKTENLPDYMKNLLLPELLNSL